MTDVPEEELPSRTGELYIPEAKLDPNVKRMAWLLFLEWWKASIALAYKRKLEGQEAHPPDTIKMVYTDCLAAAKIVWHEQEKGYEQLGGN